jgi:micrococcal nuclease|tara:strand:- start:3618 stop:4082 length:465 start_codon:yes stop_codon:yes gene_type:complete
MYEYKCKILRVVDGDTVDIDIDLGFGIWVHKERVRMMGIDTPESRTRDLVEKQFGLASKVRLKELLPVGSIQILKTEIDKSGEDKKGKFGRVLGDFLIERKVGGSHEQNVRVTSIMIDEGHGVKYFGQNKADIEKDHMINRQRLLHEGVVVLNE